MSSRGQARSTQRLITARSAHGAPMKLSVTERIIPIGQVGLGNRRSEWRVAVQRDDGVRTRIK